MTKTRSGRSSSPKPATHLVRRKTPGTTTPLEGLSSVAKTAKATREKRIKKDGQERKSRREALVNSKRYKLSNLTELTQENIELALEDVKKSAKSTEKEKLVHALNTLLPLLHHEVIELNQKVAEYVQNDGIKLILILLKSSEEEQILAVECICNIAAGEHPLSSNALKAVPSLVEFLGGKNATLQELAAWAIGNLAADQEFIPTLREHDILEPLVKLLVSEEDSVVITACFALSMLSRSSTSENDDFVAKVSDLYSEIERLLRDKNDPELISEICWVISYLTAHSQLAARKWMPTTVFQSLLQKLSSLLDLKPDHKKSDKHYHPSVTVRAHLAVPAVRAIGNFLAVKEPSTEKKIIDTLLRESDGIAVLIRAARSPARSVRKEGLWCLANLMATEAFVKADGDAFGKAIKTIETELVSNDEGVDLKKEAAYAVLNLATRDIDTLNVLPNKTLLPCFLGFLKGSDAELIRLSLNYIDIVLHHARSQIDTPIPAILDALELFANQGVMSDSDEMKDDANLAKALIVAVEKEVDQEGGEMEA